MPACYGTCHYGIPPRRLPWLIQKKFIEEETLSRPVTIKYSGTEEIVGIFADQAIISHSTGLFTLYFFQMQFPPTPTKEDLQTLEAIPASCVARIILTPTLMQQFSMVIIANLERYNKAIVQQLQPEADRQAKEE